MEGAPYLVKKLGCQNGPMNTLTPINLDTWPRREHFTHYMTAVPCTYSLTTEIDVTRFASAMRATHRKTYIAQIWALARIVNNHEEFRMSIGDDGAPGVWDVVHPSFTVFNPERETFASIWCPYDDDFATFHASAAPLLTHHKNATALLPQNDQPANSFDVSSIPWTSFTGFTLHVRNPWQHLFPIFTLGRYRTHEGRVFMPLAVQVHHAAADGFHTSRLIAELESLMNETEWAG